MRFYGREQELKVLRDTAEASMINSQFTVVLGRRRIGKTTLMLKGSEGRRTVYLFISRLSEPVLCSRLQSVARESSVEIPGKMETFGDLLEALMLHSAHDPLTVIIDEFQNLRYVNPSIFGDMQRVWDLRKDEARMNLVVGGSVHSMMVRIFEDSGEPLFGRATRKLELRPFRVSDMKDILSDHRPGWSNGDLLTLYMLTGGVPSYIGVLMDAGAFTSESMLDLALSPGSVFLREGNDLMTEEFGKDNRTYLSMLQLIASGRNQRPEIENTLKVSAGEYLRRLESEYGFVRRRLPIPGKDPRLGRWELTDMYLSFHFRYIQPNASFVESGRFDLLRETVSRDLESYEGRVLEHYFLTRMSEERRYTEIGGYWNRKGDVEIDVVVLDSSDGTAELMEVKRNPAKLDMTALRRKAETLDGLLGGYSVTCIGLSMDDMRSHPGGGPVEARARSLRRPFPPSRRPWPLPLGLPPLERRRPLSL